MGQKINPLGFRLGTTQSHDSIWFAQPTNYLDNYSDNLKEDKIIRDCIKNYIEQKHAFYLKKNTPYVSALVRIKIQKRIDLLQVIIVMGSEGGLLFEDKPRTIEELKMNVQKKVNCANRELKMEITVTPTVYENANILAEFIGFQLKNRISFRKAMKQAIEFAEDAGTKGIQVQIAGRIDGKEIARVEWIREGRVPLQTIRAKMDYCAYTVRTIYGVLGIKVWVFLNNE